MHLLNVFKSMSMIAMLAFSSAASAAHYSAYIGADQKTYVLLSRQDQDFVVYIAEPNGAIKWYLASYDASFSAAPASPGRYSLKNGEVLNVFGLSDNQITVDRTTHVERIVSETATSSEKLNGSDLNNQELASLGALPNFAKDSMNVIRRVFVTLKKQKFVVQIPNDFKVAVTHIFRLSAQGIPEEIPVIDEATSDDTDYTLAGGLALRVHAFSDDAELNTNTIVQKKTRVSETISVKYDLVPLSEAEFSQIVKNAVPGNTP